MFDPSSRQIFAYYDGSIDTDGHLKQVRGDPIALHRNLLRVAGGESQFAGLWERAHATEPNPDYKPDPETGKRPLRYTDTALQERAVLAETVRQGFNLQPLDPDGPGGLTESEMLDVLYSFYEFQKKSQMSTENSPNN